MRIVLIFALFVSFTYSLEIDIQSLKKEAENDPSNINARIILAKEYIKTKEFEKAKTFLDEVLALNPKHKKANFLMSKLTINKSPKMTDEERYKKILNDKEDVDTALKLYDLYIKQNKMTKAKDLKMRYWRKSINNPIYKALEKKEQTKILARANRLQNRYKQSHKFSDFKEYYYELEGLGYKEKGFSKLEEFVKDNSLNEEAALFLANQYYWQGRSKESRKVLKPLIDNHTKNRKILTLYKKLRHNSGKNKINTLKNRAEKYYTQKNYKKSLPLYKKYLKKVSNDNISRFHYASALENIKQYKKAEKQYLIITKHKDKLYELASYRYARVLMAQKDEIKWDKARDVLTDLLESILNHKSSKESDEILKYTQQSLKIVSQPMPKATMHKDIMLTESQSKILNQSTFSESSIQKQYVSSIKGMINPNLSAISADTTIQASVFTTMLNDDTIQNRGYGITLANQNFSITAKKSTFKNDINRTKLDVATLSASYSNSDDFSVSIGVNSFEDSTDVVGKIELRKAYKNHNITYGIGYQNGIFINGSTCSIKNNINAISLSLYDLILLKNLEEAEATLVINSFSDSNLNINSWINYPLYRSFLQNLQNSFSLSGSYEYNSKKDTCYNAAEFFDTTQVEMRSKYEFNSGYLEAKGSIGYSFKNGEVVYSYGFLLQLMTSDSVDLSIDCRHYQSGYSPDGADECYASFTKVW